jgi:membrane protein
MSSSAPESGPQHGSLWKLGGLTPWRLGKNVVRNSDRDDLLGSASGLAFNSLLALFPLLLFLLTLFGLFASHSSQLESSLLSFCADLLPPEASELLSKITGELVTNSGGGKLAFGIIVGLWFAGGGMTSMISTLNVAYGVRETRPWYIVRAIGLGLTLAISFLLLSALFMVLLGGHFMDWAGREVHLSRILVTACKDLQWPGAILFVIASFSLIYNFGPNFAHRVRHWITPGSVFGAVLWFAASSGFRIYLHFLNTYSATYGSLGALMILLIWLYVTGLAVLIGGEINAEIERAATAQFAPP